MLNLVPVPVPVPVLYCTSTRNRITISILRTRAYIFSTPQLAQFTVTNGAFLQLKSTLRFPRLYSVKT